MCRPKPSKQWKLHIANFLIPKDLERYNDKGHVPDGIIFIQAVILGSKLLQDTASGSSRMKARYCTLIVCISSAAGNLINAAGYIVAVGIFGDAADSVAAILRCPVQQRLGRAGAARYNARCFKRVSLSKNQPTKLELNCQ